MIEMTQEDALLLADELVGQALKETEARCSVLAQFIHDCDRVGAKTAAGTEAVRELRALHDRRSRLMQRRSLIQQALDCRVGEAPAKDPLPPAPTRIVRQTQQQIQVRPRRHS
jgi:hypothetical protein